MKARLFSYMYLGALIGTAVVTYNSVEQMLNNFYKPDINFSEEKAKKIHMVHKGVAGLLAFNSTVTVAEAFGRIIFKKV